MRSIVAFVVILSLSSAILAADTTAVPGTSVASNTTAAPPTQEQICASLTLPTAYSRNLRYVLLVGFGGLLLAALIFFGLSVSENGNKVIHVLSFLLTSALCLGYFSLWEGLGAYFKPQVDGCALIMIGRFIALLFTLPIAVAAFTLFARVDKSAIVGASGSTVFTMFCWMMGATITGNPKYFWWFVGVLFAVLSCVQYFGIANGSSRSLSPSGASAANIVFISLSISMLCYSAIWIIGSTGTGFLHLSTEVALYILIDIISHFVVGIVMISSGESILETTPLLDGSASMYGSGYANPNSNHSQGSQNQYNASRQFV